MRATILCFSDPARATRQFFASIVLPEHSALLFADGALREIRRNDRFDTYLGAFDGSKVVNDLRIATLLPATVIWRPAT